MPQNDASGSAAEWAFRRHYDDVYRYLVRRTGDPHLAEELVQQVFADAVTHLEVEHGSTPVLAWLYTVARRRFADEARRRARQGIGIARLEGLARAWGAADSYGSRVATAIRHALTALEPEARAVVVMKLLEGRSFAEISQRTGISEPAARMRFVRALRLLRAELEKRGVEP